VPKTLKQGRAVSRSGEYEIRGSRGGATGKERVVVRGKPLPPTPKGQKKTLRLPLHGAVVTKSGWLIIPSPAKSANTISSWSKAFKK